MAHPSLRITPNLVRAQRAARVAAARATLSTAAGVASGGPVRVSAMAAPRETWPAAALLHAGVALAVAGAATVLALIVFVIPAPVFLLVFGIVTTVLMVLGVSAVASGRVLAGRGWLAWAGLGWGLVVASAAYLLQITGLVPHLWLVWTLGVLVLGVTGAGAVQTALAGVLATVWVVLAALVGESLLPGAVILAVLFGFPVLARPSRLVGAAGALLTITLAVTAALRWHGAAPAVPLAVLTALAAAGVLRVAATRLPVEAATGAPPTGCPGYGIAWVTGAVGLVAVTLLPLAPVLDRLRHDVAGAPTATRMLLVPAGVLLIVAVLPGRRRPGALLPTALWVAGCVTATTALLAPAPVAEALRVLTALVVVGLGVRATRRPGRAVQLRGLALVALGAGLLVLGSPPVVVAAAVAAVGGYAVLLARRVAGGTGPPPVQVFR